MVKRFSLLVALISLSVFACGASASVYALDNNYGNQEVVGEHAAEQAFINVFTTNSSAPVIEQLRVAWAGIPVGSNVRMALYSVSDLAADPLPEYTDPTTFLTLLQVVSSQITAGQRNDDGVGVTYVSDPIWTSYGITPTHITTQRFAVAAIAYEDNLTCGCVWQDGTALTNPAANDILIAEGPGTGDSLNSDLSNPGTALYNLRTFEPYLQPKGSWDYPYLIRAAGVPMGDATLDGTVNIDDFSVLLAHWGNSGQSWQQGDVTGDTVVNIDDFSVLLAHWGNSSPLGFGFASMQTPEPTTLVLLGLGGLALLRRRNSK